jgi:hypothetical protein
MPGSTTSPSSALAEAATDDTRPFFVPAKRLIVFPGQAVETRDNGAIRSLPGNKGFVLYGPYMPARAGLYKVSVRARVVGPDPSYFDLFADSRILTYRSYKDGPTFYVHIADTQGLEFRFKTQGEEFIVEGIDFIPLVLDDEEASPEALLPLIEELLAGDTEIPASFRLVDRLARTGCCDDAARFRTQFVARGREPGATIRSIFHAINTPGAVALPSRDKLTVTRDRINDEIASWPTTTFDLLNLSAEDHANLRARGYRAEFIQATTYHRCYGDPPREWQSAPIEVLSEPNYFRRAPLFERYVDFDRSHQWELVMGGGMSAYCPISGRLLKSTHGFCIHLSNLPALVYRFEGDEIFYIVTGNITNKKLCMYFPKSQTVVITAEHWLCQIAMHKIIQLLNLNMIDSCDDVRRYLSDDTRPAAVLGDFNFGHFLWVTLTGLHHAARSGLLSKIEEVVEVQGYFISAQRMFPELADKPSTYFSTGSDDSAAVFSHCLVRRLLPIHFTDAVISDSFAERVRDAAARHATAAGRVPHDAPRPLVWINLRAHSKIWLGQAEGYANILNELRKDFGKASAFIDGWADCADVAAEIRRLTHPDIPLYDGLNLDPYDSLNWAFGVDAYVCVIGSGLVMVNCVANKPGVVHAELAHMTQLNWWHWLRLGSIPPAAPDIDDITDVGPSECRGRLYANYEVSWKILLNLLRNELESSGFAIDRKADEPVRPDAFDQIATLPS